tara:strand:+ start:7415 stop:8275 length:861 start_codon:yes stop_codon:yes gene_type:complete
MIQSMTGYGRASAGQGNNKISIIIRSVNGRFLDLKLRGFDIDPSLDKKIRDLLSDRLIRGTVHINFESETSQSSESHIFNENRFELLLKTLNSIEKKYNKKLNLSDIINSNDLFISNEFKSIDSKIILKAISSACSKVIKMRREEGLKLKKDIELRLSNLREGLHKIEAQLPVEHKKRIKRLKKRLSELIDNIQIDETRVNQEIAIIAEKSDVTEELVRLKSHFEQFEKILKDNKPSGGRLNFLLQEIGREINTIGSKSFSNKIVNNIIYMKDEAEKIKEQIQNIL